MAPPLKIIIICGPTGSGKTRLGVRLAHLLNGEVVGADSRQVYIGMDIGTWKPTHEEKRGIPHYLIDVVPPDGEFNAFIFNSMADRQIHDILRRGKKAIVVGGTGLYLKALTRGLAQGIGPFPEIRKKLLAQMSSQGSSALYEWLARVDPISAERIQPEDSFRVMRALEVYCGTGDPLSSFHRAHAFSETRYAALWIGMAPPRSQLYEHINRRVEVMFGRGLVEEVVRLRSMGYGPDLPSMKGLGYAEVGRYLAGGWSLEDAKDAIKRNTRNYAKRQMTWFRSERDILWHENNDDEKIDQEAVRFYKNDYTTA